MLMTLVRVLVWPVAAAVVVVLPLLGVASAQTSEKSELIYLEEIREPPPVREVRSRTIETKYEGEETIRVKFKIVQLSDDSFVNDGPYVEYYKDGQKYQEGTFKRGAYDGQWTYWHPNGQVCRKINFKDGKPDGQWEVFREDGTRQEFQSYANGTREGTWKSFYEDGETPLVEFTYQSGDVTGKRISYFKNGKKRQEVHIKKGRLHGLTTEWDEAGKKVLEANFENGKRVGDLIRF